MCWFYIDIIEDLVYNINQQYLDKCWINKAGEDYECKK